MTTTIAGTPELEDLLPLSPLAAALVFHAEAARDGFDPYLVQVAVDLVGELDAARLARALADVVDRHESLRSCFRNDRTGRPVQVVLRRVEVPVEHDLLAGHDWAARADELAERDRVRPFDLRTPPLLRARLFTCPDRRYRLVLTVHHVLVDGWSLPVLLTDLLRRYEGGPPTGRPPRHREHLALTRGQDSAAARRAWTESIRRLSEPSLLIAPQSTMTRRRLPTAVPIPISGPELDLVDRWARHGGWGLNAVVRIAWARLLGSLLGRRTVVFGTTVSTRRPELEGYETMVGLYVNTVPVVVDLDPDDTLAAAVGTARREQLDLMPHEHLGLTEIHQLAGLGTLFDTVVLFESYPVTAASAVSLPRVRVDAVVGRDATHYPVVLVVVPGASGSGSMRLEIDPDRVDLGTARRWAERLATVLRAMPADAEQRLGRLNELLPSDRELVLHAWGRVGPGPSPAQELLPPRLERSLRRHAGRTAVRDTGGTMTYAELHERADRLARRLAHRGVGPGDLVGIAVGRHRELIVAATGVLLAGAAYLALDPSYPPDRLRYVVQTSAPKLVLVDEVDAARGVPGIDADVLVAVHELVDGTDADADADDQGAATRARACLGPDDPAYVIFTSGSTGRPKGVVVRHGGLVNLLVDVTAAVQVTASSRWLAVTTFAFDIAALELLGPLLHGAEVIVAAESQVADVDQLAGLLVQHAVSHLQATPSLWGALIGSRPDDLSQVVALTGGEAVSDGLAHALVRRCRRAVNVYGPTETTVWSGLADLDDGPVTIGHPIDQTGFLVLDPWLRPAPPGVVGELYITGTGLARGYLGQPGPTSSRFVANPWGESGARMYRTGDLARWAPDGRLRCLGRTDHQVKVRGHRIELGELESALSHHPRVRAAAAAVQAQHDGSSALVLFVTGSDLDHPTLRRFLAERLPAYMLPDRTVVLSELPLTDNGKVDRARLPLELDDPEHTAPSTPVRADDALLALVCSEVSQVLDVAVGPDDDFFARGGHSLSAARLVSRLRGSLELEVELADVFERPTPRELVTRLTGLVDPGDRPQRLGLTEGPLSAAQHRIWIMHRSDGASAAYTIVVNLVLAGELSSAALRAAGEDLLSRHEILRTVYPATRSQVRQLVVAPVDAAPRLQVTELTAEALSAELARPFDLAVDLPLRLALVGQPDGRHRVVVQLHHIAADGTAVRVVLAELARDYAVHRSRREGTSPTLPSADPDALQYLDIAAWEQRNLRRDGAGRAHRVAEWRDAVADAPAVLALPYDRPRADEPSGCGSSVRSSVGSDLHRGLLGLAQNCRVTPFMVLQAAVGTLFEAIGAGTDLPFGVAVHGRPLAELERLVGMFSNTVVLRLDLSGRPTVTELLGRVREQSLWAYSRQDIGFEEVVAAVQPERVAGRHPLFQTFLGLDVHQAGSPLAEVEGDGVLPTDTAKFDLSFEFTEHRTVEGEPRGIDLHLEYDTDLFDDSTARRLADLVPALVQQLVSRPEARVNELDLLTAAERTQLLTLGRGSVGPLGADVPTSVDRQTAIRPGACAIEDERSGRRWDYAALQQLVTATTDRLVRAGVSAGDLVALLMEPGAETVATILSLWRLGAAYVPLAPTHPQSRTCTILAETGAVRLVGTAEHRELGQAICAQVPGVTMVLVDAAAALGPTPAVPARELPGAAAAYVLFTSGSTGRPKGAVVTRHGLLNHLRAKIEDLGLTTTDTVVQNAGLTFDISVWQMFAALMVGGTVVVPSLEAVGDPDALLSCRTRHRATVLELVPSLLRSVRSLGRGAGPAFDGLRWLLVTGEALPGELADWWVRTHPEIPLVNAYGPTECSDDVTHAVIERPDPLRRPIAPIGTPIRATRLYVLDQHLRLVPPGAVGELYVAGAGVGRGYVGRPGLTAGTFVADPFGSGGRLYRTGDNVCWRSDGKLEFRERVDHQVKIRGYRIELGEVESVLRAAPGVRDAAVTVAGSTGAPRLAAYVVGPDHVLTAATDHVKQHLPSPMVPTLWARVDALPLTANGKVDRAALTALTPAVPPTRGAAAELAAGDDPTVDQLRSLFATVTGAVDVAADDDFFDIGGDSIRAIELVALAREKDIDLSVARVLSARNPAAMAAAAGSRAIADDDGLGPLRPPPALLELRRRGGSLAGFVQDVVLVVPAHVGAEHLDTALRAVVDTHDALRIRISADGDLEVAPPGPVTTVDRFDARPADGERPSGLASARRRVISQLDPTQGRLIALGLIEHPVSLQRRLVVAAHHLAVDQVSWEGMLRDLVDAAEQASQGRDPSLLPVVTSYRRWVHDSWDAVGRRGAVELPYWDALVGVANLLPAPTEVASPAAPIRRIWSTVPSSETGELLDELRARRHGVESAIVAAVGLAVSDEARRGPSHEPSAATSRLLVDLESHGRVDTTGRSDLSRTVGWFTATFPLCVEVADPRWSAPRRMAATLVDVDTARRRVPDQGANFSLLQHDSGPGHRLSAVRPELVVNYLGTAELTNAPSGWGLAPESDSLRAADPPGHDPTHRLSVDALLVGPAHDRRLTLRWDWAPGLPAGVAGRIVADAMEWLLQVAAGASARPADPSPARSLTAGARRPAATGRVDPFASTIHLQEGTGPVTLYGLHGGVGLAWPYVNLLPHLSPGVGLIGLQSVFAAGRGPGQHASSLATLAEGYVDRLRRLDPHGPYRMLGWSFGGFLAHEMAVQLQRAGSTVDYLAVVDIFPGHGFDDEGDDDAASLALLLGAAGCDLSDPLLARAVAATDLPEVVRLVRGSTGALSSIDASQLAAVLAQIRQHGQLGARHRPGVFDGDLELVVADLDPPGRVEVDPARLWRSFVSGTVHARRVASHHDDLLDPGQTASWAPSVLARLPVGASARSGGR